MTTAVSARMRPFFSVHHGRFGKENRASTFLFDKTDSASEKLKQASFFARLVRFFTHLALSFHKIGGGSEKKIVQALFFSLTLHYLCILN